MPELMQTVDGYLSAARDGVNPVAEGAATETVARAAHQQSTLATACSLFQLVVAKRQIGIKTLQHHLRQRPWRLW